MDEYTVQRLVSEWDDVYKKGQLSLWVLLAIADSRKYSAQITAFMNEASNGAFDVKEQSLYRALRRFEAMGLVSVAKEKSPNSGSPRKYFALTQNGKEVLRRFLQMHIEPLRQPVITKLMDTLKEGVK